MKFVHVIIVPCSELLLLICFRCHLHLQILIGGFLETLSLCYITIVGLTVLSINPSAIVLFMCSLAVVPAIWQAIKSRSRCNTMSGKLHVFKFATSAIIAVLGIALLSWKVNAKPACHGFRLTFVSFRLSIGECTQIVYADVQVMTS